MMTSAEARSNLETSYSSSEWRKFAACRSLGPAIFFAEGRAQDKDDAAKEICRNCRTQSDCLIFALVTKQAHGVWGGLSEEERRGITIK